MTTRAHMNMQTVTRDDGAMQLYICLVNDPEIWKNIVIPVYRNLQRKTVKGIYSSEKAQKAFTVAIRETVKKYRKYYLENPVAWNAAEKRQCAGMLVTYFESNYQNTDF